jgi:arylsulfatase A-like enzyme
MCWRMLHRSQRALRVGDWKYLRVDEHEYLFNLHDDERERANRAAHEPERLEAMRQQWLDWNAQFPPVPGDATVSLIGGLRDMPSR